MLPSENRASWGYRMPFRAGLLLVLVHLSTAAAIAQVPQHFRYQGRLTDASGNAMTGAAQVTFRLYDVETGGTPLWEEVDTVAFGSQGIFATTLGNDTPFGLAFDTQYFLGVSLDAGVTELAPRQALVPVPYALQAGAAVQALAAGAVTGAANSFPGSGDVGIGTGGTPGDRLHLSFSQASPIGGASGLTIENTSAAGTAAPVLRLVSGAKSASIQVDKIMPGAGGMHFDVGGTRALTLGDPDASFGRRVGVGGASVGPPLDHLHLRVLGATPSGRAGITIETHPPFAGAEATLYFQVLSAIQNAMIALVQTGVDQVRLAFRVQGIEVQQLGPDYASFSPQGSESLRVTSTAVVVGENADLGVGTVAPPEDHLHVRFDQASATAGRAGVTIENAHPDGNAEAILAFQVFSSALTGAIALVQEAASAAYLALRVQGNEIVRIDPEGLTINPPGTSLGSLAQVALDVFNAGEHVLLVAGNKVLIGLSAPDPVHDHRVDISGALNVRGDIRVDGVVVHASDARLKTAIAPLETALGRVEGLRPVSYEWDRTSHPGRGFPEGRHLGLLAQELEPHFPELVVTQKDGLKGVDYQGLTPVLIRAIQEQQALIRSLQERLDRLENPARERGAGLDAAPARAGD